MGCIYKIVNLINKKFYVGSTINEKARKNTHFCKLRKGYHDNQHLQNSFNKHGEKAFLFEVIEANVEGDKLEERELYYLQLLKPQYNLSTSSVRPMLGRKLSEDHRIKMSLAKGGKGVLKQPKTDNGLSLSEKMREATKAYYASLSPAERKARNAHKVGRVFSEATKRKLSKKAKKRKWSDEVKQKISNSLKRKKLTHNTNPTNEN